jgi:hypothetical protein
VIERGDPREPDGHDRTEAASEEPERASESKTAA